MTTRVPPPPSPLTERKLRWPAICTECCGPILVCLALLFALLYPLMLIGTIPNPVLDNDIFFSDDTSCTSMSNYYAMHWWLICKGLMYLCLLFGVIAIPAVLIFVIFDLLKHCIGLCNGTRVCCTEETKLNCKKSCIDCCSPYETIA